jgi:hypothetical protein
MTQDDNSKDLIISVLKQRIGELSAAYEFEIAKIRAEYTKLDSVCTELSKRLHAATEPPKEEKSFPSVSELLEDA